MQNFLAKQLTAEIRLRIDGPPTGPPNFKTVAVNDDQSRTSILNKLLQSKDTLTFPNNAERKVVV